MIRRVLFALLLAAIGVYTVFPFYWALVGSFQSESSIFASPAHYVPAPPVLDSYRQVFSNATFVRALANSVVVACATTLLALAAGSLAAYALARYRMRGREATLTVILALTMFPQISVVGAVHTVVTRLGLHNTLAGLVVSYMLITLPFTVWVLTNFFRSLPRELEESAYVDGATPLQTFWRVLMPLSAPGLVTTGLLTFISAWNEYLFALSLTVTDRARTVPVALANFAGASAHQTPWGAIMAASVVVTLPLVILVLVFQRRLVEGLTAGALKG